MVHVTHERGGGSGGHVHVRGGVQGGCIQGGVYGVIECVSLLHGLYPYFMHRTELYLFFLTPRGFIFPDTARIHIS